MSERNGYEPITGLYYEVIGNSAADAPPLMFIHGGGGPAGAYWRTTPDSRPGWAELLASSGYQCWVTDYPGVGRSAPRVFADLGYDEVVDGYRALLALVAQPCVLVPHSMGGYIAWKLVELVPEAVAGVISIACPPPGNLIPTFEVLHDDGREIVLAHNRTGIRLTVDRSELFIPDEEHARGVISVSHHFPACAEERWLASVAAMPPLLLLQRFGVAPGLPAIVDTRGFVDMEVLCVTADADRSHTQEIDRATVELLASWGAAVEHLYLPDEGIVGNGHYMMVEDNNAEVLEHIQARLAAGFGRGRSLQV